MSRWTLPRWTLQRIPTVPAPVRVASYAVSVLVALVLGGVVLALVGMAPLALGGAILHASFGTRFGLEDLALLATPLILMGLSVSMMLRVGLWNIGADGQFYVGAICAAGIGLFLHGPYTTMLAAMALAACLGGAAWIAVPALARLTLGTSEIITTLLLNFVARLGVDYLVTGVWRDQRSSVTGQTRRIPFAIPKLPRDWHAGPVHWGLFAALLLAVLLALAFRRTRWGYELRVCGANRNAAAYAGMPVRRRLLQAMLLGGAIAGLGGMIELAGTVHRLESGLSNGYGYTGIIVAVLANASPIGAIFTGALMALVLNAGTILQNHGVPASAAMASVGLILLCAAIGERLVHYRPARLRQAVPAG